MRGDGTRQGAIFSYLLAEQRHSTAVKRHPMRDCLHETAACHPAHKSNSFVLTDK